MPRSRAALASLSLLAAASLLSPADARAGGFTPLWSLPGWDYIQEVGNTDGDPQRELLFASKADGHLALVDGVTGVVAKEFPDFAHFNTLLTATDVDADGRLELFFWRPSAPLVTGYDWVGGTYSTLFSHTASVDQLWGLVNFRGPTTFDAVEVSNNDVRVRDLSGNILFMASSMVPSWSGNAPVALSMDVDQDGVQELGLVENNFSATAKVHFFDYAAGFTPMWTVSGWMMLGAVHTDLDAQPEIIMAHGADGHYGLFDGISGHQEASFPGFSIYQAANLATSNIDADAEEELFLWRPEDFPTTRLFIAYDYGMGTYTQKFAHTDPVDNFSIGNFRGPTQLDFLETFTYPSSSMGDVRVRDLDGNVFFQGSTNLPGWSGANMLASPIDSDHDGIQELVIQDHQLRFVRWSGAALTQQWSTAAWSLQTDLANVDGDPESELLVTSTADQRFALLTPASGAVEQEFPAFHSDESYANPLDADGDGRLELFFSPLGFGPQLTTAYDWTPSGWVTLFSHTDEIQGFGHGHFRTAGAIDLAEFGPSDLRVRALSGFVLFRASRDLPGWTGVNRNMHVVDVNGDGVHEILAMDAGSIWLVSYTGSTAVADLDAGGGVQLLGSAPNPFTTGTTLRFSTRAAGAAGIRIFDASGRLVRNLDRHATAGSNEIRWDGRDERGRAVPSGILFYEVAAGGTRRTGRMVRLSR